MSRPIAHQCAIDKAVHDNLGMFPNAGSITTSVRLDKILAVPVIYLIFTAESLSAQVHYSKDQYLCLPHGRVGRHIVFPLVSVCP